MNKQIKKKILDSISKAESKGYTLITDDWGSGKEKCACPISCVLVANDQPISIQLDDAARILGVSQNWIQSFADGFDGNGNAKMAHEPDAWSLGEEIRKETKPIPYSTFIDELIQDGEEV